MTCRLPTDRLIRLVMLILLPVAGAVAFVALNKWPAGADAGGGFALSPATQPTMQPTVRLATFNINSARARGLGAVADELTRFDLVGLQEVQGSFSGPSQAQRLGQMLALNALFAPTERTRFHDDFGNALLTRLPVDAWQRIPLPGSADSYRNVLVVRTRIGSEPMTVLITHIDRVEDRAIQLQYLWQLFAGQPEPVVLMGDLNTLHDDPLLHEFLTRATDAVGMATPERDPPRIDWIFTRGLRITDGGIRETDASDHPVVWVELAR